MAARWLRVTWVVLVLALAACGGGGGGGGGGTPITPPQFDARSGARGVPVRLDVDDRARTLWLDGDVGGDEYVLILASLANSSGNARLTVNGGQTLLPLLTKREAHGLPRDVPADRAGSGLGGRCRPPFTRQALGDPRDFIFIGHTASPPIQSTLRAVGDNALLYLDDATPAGALNDAELSDLADQFDRVILPMDRELFGEPSDVDHNGKVVLLLTPQVNEQGYGFFFGGDTTTGGGNQADLLYLLVPDANRPYDVLRPDLLATEAHELQHLINNHYKNLIHQVAGGEESWLNEALSFVGEQYQGFLDTAGGSPPNVELYFRSPETYTLLERTGNYDDGHAGAGYLFLRYLVDRFGVGILKTLVQSDLRGRENVTAATGASFDSLFIDWAAAVYLNGTGLNSEAKYAIPGFATRADYVDGTVHITGPSSTTVAAADGAPAFAASWARGGLRFLRVRQPPADGVTLSLTAKAGDRVTVLAVRVPATQG